MGSIERNKKRRWWFWQHWSLILSLILCFFYLQTPLVIAKKPNRVLNKISKKSTTQLKLASQRKSKKSTAQRKFASQRKSKKSTTQRKFTSQRKSKKSAAQRNFASQRKSKKLATQRKLASQRKSKKSAAQRKLASQRKSKKLATQRKLASQRKSKKSAAQRKLASQRKSKKLATQRKLISQKKSKKSAAQRKFISQKKSKKLATQRKFISPSGAYKIPYIKTGSLFNKLKLKKGDLIQSVQGKAINSKKQLYQIIFSAPKKQKDFSIFLVRNKKSFLFFYKLTTSKKKKKFFIYKIEQITNKKPKIKKGQKSSKTKNNPSASIQKTSQKTTKKLIVPQKFKKFLQLAYIVSTNSFIYKKPDFDSKQIHALQVGEKILVSKKIFRPTHNFGTFYKAFVINPKKIIGFISEVEIVTEFSKKGNQYVSNSNFKLAQKQIKEDKVLDVNFLSKQKAKEQNVQKEQKTKNNKKRYAGLSFSVMSSKFQKFNQKDIQVGLKLSGYNLLISSLNMDLNLMISPYDRKFLHFDILAGYPLFRGISYHIYMMAGLKLDVNKRIQDIRKQIDPGPTLALSLLLPINRKILFRIDGKGDFGLSTQTFNQSLLASLQLSF